MSAQPTQVQENREGSRAARTLLRTAQCLALSGVLTLPLVNAQVASLFGFPVQLADALLVLSMLACGLAIVAGVPLRLTAFHAWLVFFLGAMTLAVVTSPDVHDSFGKWVGICYLALLAALVCQLATYMSFVRDMVMAWLWGSLVAVAVGVVAILAFYASPATRDAAAPLMSHYGSLPPGNYPRVLSTFNNPNMFCSYLNVTMALMLAAWALGWLHRTQALVYMALLLAVALFTLSPGLGGIALTAGAWIWLCRQNTSPVPARIALWSGVVVASLILAGVALVDLANPIEAMPIRWRIWQAAMATWTRHPWIGVGLGQDVVSVGFHSPEGYWQHLSDAHNLWLSIAGQSGLIGFLALLGLVLYLLRRSLPMRMDTEVARLRTACLLAFLTAFLYQGMAASLEDARHVWLLIGLLAALTQIGLGRMNAGSSAASVFPAGDGRSELNPRTHAQ